MTEQRDWLMFGLGTLLIVGIIIGITAFIIALSQAWDGNGNGNKPSSEKQAHFVEGNNNCGKIVGILKPGHISSFQIRPHSDLSDDQRLFTMSCKLKVNKLKLEGEGSFAKLHVLEGPMPRITIAPLTYGGIGLRVNAIRTKEDMEISIPNNEWFHLVYVQKINSALVYINGQLRKQEEGGFVNKTEKVYEVRISGDTQWHQIKDITLCTRALNLYEIQEL